LNKFIDLMQLIYLPPVDDIDVKSDFETRAALYFLFYLFLLIKKYKTVEEN